MRAAIATLSAAAVMGAWASTSVAVVAPVGICHTRFSLPRRAQKKVIGGTVTSCQGDVSEVTQEVCLDVSHGPAGYIPEHCVSDVHAVTAGQWLVLASVRCALPATRTRFRNWRVSATVTVSNGQATREASGDSRSLPVRC